MIVEDEGSKITKMSTLKTDNIQIPGIMYQQTDIHNMIKYLLQHII